MKRRDLKDAVFQLKQLNASIGFDFDWDTSTNQRRNDSRVPNLDRDLVTSVIIDGFKNDEGLLEPIGALRDVTDVGIVNSFITSRTLQVLGRLPCLAYLSLYGCPISDKDLQILSDMRLRTLVLTRTNVSAEGIAAVGRLLPDCEIFG